MARTKVATKVATAALTAFVARKAKAPMRRLGIANRAALLDEWRRLRPIHDGWECARDRYPAQAARIWALDLLSDLPKNGSDVDTIDYCLTELAEVLPGALTRPLTKEEIADVRAVIMANTAECERREAQWKAEWDSRRFAQAICGEDA